VIIVRLARYGRIGPLVLLAALVCTCSETTRVIKVALPPEPCPELARPCQEEPRRPLSCAPSPLVGRVLWESPEGDVRAYEKCTWGSRGGEPAAESSQIIVERPGGEPATFEVLSQTQGKLYESAHSAMPGLVSFGAGHCRPEFANGPVVPCLFMRTTTARTTVETIARQVRQALGPDTTNRCILVDVEINAGSPEMLRTHGPK